MQIARGNKLPIIILGIIVLGLIFLVFMGHRKGLQKSDVEKACQRAGAKSESNQQLAYDQYLCKQGH